MKATAKFITEISVLDPDSGGMIQLSVYKENESDGMFAIDSSYITTFDDDDEIIVPSLFGNGKIKLIE